MLDQQKSGSYEWKVLIILTLLWGTVALDRLAVVFLFPVIIPEFNLTNAQAGAITSILSMCWAVSVYICGNVSDRIGRKIILLPATIFFSLMSWVTGTVKSFGSLLVVRGLMGAGEGAVYSTSIATLSDVSTPSKRGFNFGFHQCSFPLVGMGFGAILCTQMANAFGWRPTFFIAGIPGIILAIFMAFMIKESHKVKKSLDNSVKGSSSDGDIISKPGLFDAFKYRNVLLSTLIAGLYFSWMFIFSTFATLYLTEYRGLDLGTAGFIMSGMGFGGAIGMIVLGALSDHLGRRPVVITSMIIAGISYLFFLYVSPNPALLFVIILLGSFFGMGSSPIYLATIPTESVPKNIAGSAVAIPIALGEAFGAMGMPVIAGFFADKFDLSIPILIAGLAGIIAGIVGLVLIETAPGVLARINKTGQSY